tara:strand:- start:305 stop:481 length:177 start_codon:yes stop_codon:yes gene_type:complete
MFELPQTTRSPMDIYTDPVDMSMLRKTRKHAATMILAANHNHGTIEGLDPLVCFEGFS